MFQPIFFNEMMLSLHSRKKNDVLSNISWSIRHNNRHAFIYIETSMSNSLICRGFFGMFLPFIGLALYCRSKHL
jgi:hypothetical protein